MRTEKVYLTLEKAREVVGARLASFLAELEQEKGPIEPEVMEEVRRALPAPREKAAKRCSA